MGADARVDVRATSIWHHSNPNDEFPYYRSPEVTSPIDAGHYFRSTAVDRTSIGLKMAEIWTIEFVDREYKLMDLDYFSRFWPNGRTTTCSLANSSASYQCRKAFVCHSLQFTVPFKRFLSKRQRMASLACSDDVNMLMRGRVGTIQAQTTTFPIIAHRKWCHQSTQDAISGRKPSTARRSDLKWPRYGRSNF